MTILARSRCEGAIRNSRADAPKFTCCHCRRSGQTLRHIAACGKRRSRSIVSGDGGAAAAPVVKS